MPDRLASSPSALRFPRGLYGVTPEWDDTARLYDAVAAAIKGGMTALQLRRKTAPDALRHEQALALAPLCRAHGVAFLINDDWRLALEIGADGAHLGRDDADPFEVRRAAGRLLLGVSCYNEPERARMLLEADVDYIAFGAMYPSSTKPLAVAAGPECLDAARTLIAALPAPRPAIVAIGGITPANAAPVVQAGADSLALISGLFDAPDIEQAARTCSRLF
ncbi:MAG: thiamine phosphate synthase [Corticimicrobacter sp.]|uniref:thiamine phosphate synthase n=1 Tax=Corticimicrobacter sp. TaxID=2678536 RepID=UPI0032DA80B6